MKIITTNRQCEKVAIEGMGKFVMQYNDLIIWDEKGDRKYLMHDYQSRYVIDVLGKIKVTTINRECERVEIEGISRLVAQDGDLILWDENGNRSYTLYDYKNRYVIDVTNEE